MADLRMPTTGTLTAGTRTAGHKSHRDAFRAVERHRRHSLFRDGQSDSRSTCAITVDNHPIILAQNEGLAITNPAASPKGTCILLVQMEWGELATNMGEIVLDSSGAPGIPNALSVDSGGHVPIVKRPAAFGRKGIYRAGLTSPAFVTPSADSALWTLDCIPTPQPLVLVNSVKAACTVASTITTAVQMDLGLYLLRGGGLIPGLFSGTAFAQRRRRSNSCVRDGRFDEYTRYLRYP